MASRREHEEQATVVAWARLHEHIEPRLCLLFAVPNAARRGPRLAARLKREGMRAGVSDLILLAPGRDNAHFAAIEMKVRPNKPTPEQLRFLQLVETNGGIGVVCYSASAAIKFLKWYCEMDEKNLDTVQGT